MTGVIKEIGRIIKCMGGGHLNGAMEGNMLASTEMIKSMVMVYFHGKIIFYNCKA